MLDYEGYDNLDDLMAAIEDQYTDSQKPARNVKRVALQRVGNSPTNRETLKEGLFSSKVPPIVIGDVPSKTGKGTLKFIVHFTDESDISDSAIGACSDKDTDGAANAVTLKAFLAVNGNKNAMLSGRLHASQNAGNTVVFEKPENNRDPVSQELAHIWDSLPAQTKNEKELSFDVAQYLGMDSDALFNKIVRYALAAYRRINKRDWHKSIGQYYEDKGRKGFQKKVLDRAKEKDQYNLKKVNESVQHTQQPKKQPVKARKPHGWI